MSLLFLKRQQKQLSNNSSSESESYSDEEVEKKKCRKTTSLMQNQTAEIPSVEEEEMEEGDDGLFVIDRTGTSTINANFSVVNTPLLGDSALEPYVMEKDLQKLLEKAIVGPTAEKDPNPPNRLLSVRAQKRLRRKEKEKTKGKQWFGMPATELTEENKTDLELLQMRSALDPLSHYRRSDRTVLPKYFQIGRVVDAPEDFYSSRVVKKDRKKTMVDELMRDEDSLAKARKRFTILKEKETKTRRGGFRHKGFPKSHKKQHETSEKKKKKR